MAQQPVQSHARTLAKRGVVVVEDYLPAATCDAIREAVEAALEGEELADARPRSVLPGSQFGWCVAAHSRRTDVPPSGGSNR